MFAMLDGPGGMYFLTKSMVGSDDSNFHFAKVPSFFLGGTNFRSFSCRYGVDTVGFLDDS